MDIKKILSSIGKTAGKISALVLTIEDILELIGILKAQGNSLGNVLEHWVINSVLPRRKLPKDSK